MVDYLKYNKIIEEQKAARPVSVAAKSPPTEKIGDINVSKTISEFQQNTSNYFKTEPKTAPGVSEFNASPAINEDRFISEEEQIKKFGGAVGSPEYWAYKETHPVSSTLPMQLGSAVGMEFPEYTTWDKMPTTDKIGYTLAQGAGAAFKMVVGLPAAIVKAPINLATNAYLSWSEFAKTGKVPSATELAQKPTPDIPVLGTIPNYYKNADEIYNQAKAAGRSEAVARITAGLGTVGQIAGDTFILDAIAGSLKPRMKLTEGETVKVTDPIKSALQKDKDKITGVIKKKDSINEYYSIPQTIAKEKYGGTSQNTFMKISPAGADSYEVSIVKLQGGLQKFGSYLKNKFGLPNSKITQGDLGSEIKLRSEVIKVPKISDSKIIEGEQIAAIPPKALPGFENKQITVDQIKNVELISQVNGVEPELAQSVVRTLTGKKSLGELTQKEYVDVAQSMGLLGKTTEQGVPIVNPFNRYFSPPRNWMTRQEEISGIPIYSEIYVPMEEGMKLKSITENNLIEQANQIHGKYAGVGYAGERRLIKSYMEGDKAAILENTTISPQVKTDLIKIADEMRKWYNTTGPILGVPVEAFLKGEYQPHISELGGIFSLYKQGSEIPKEISFFAKEKRSGSVNIQVDDSLALAQIYTRSGAKKKFLDSAVKRTNDLYKDLPAPLQESVKSYVLEKLGYADETTRWLNTAAETLNKKMGLNLPPDAARQMFNIGMSTAAAGGLSSPATWFRQTFQYPLFVMTRIGSKFSGDAVLKGLSKAGYKEAANAGFLIDTVNAYGESLAQEGTMLGKAGNVYKNVTQAMISPNSMSDNAVRSITYHQVKMQFEDAIARYNAGKITWDGLEKDLDFKALSIPDRNIIRERLINGDIKGAENNLIRVIIDETSFPYRKGASARITYGLTGSTATFLGKWNLEFLNTAGRYIRTGQWDKFVRYIGASSALVNTLKSTTNFDFSRSVYLGPVSADLPPTVKTAVDFTELLSNIKQQNIEEIENNKYEIVKTLKTFGIPGGVDIKNLNNFWRAYNKGPVGPNGEYATVDEQGRIGYYATFPDLFWQLFGMPTVAKTESANLKKEILNDKFKYSQLKKDVLKLYREEKYDEANQIIGEYGIQLSPSDLDQYYIPFSQRLYDSLPPMLKAKFAPRIFK